MPNRRQPLRRPRQAHMQRALEYQGSPFPHDGEHKDRHKVRSATRKAARHARQDGSPGCAFAAAARSRTAVCRGRVRRRSPCILPLAFCEPLRKNPLKSPSSQNRPRTAGVSGEVQGKTGTGRAGRIGRKPRRGERIPSGRGGCVGGGRGWGGLGASVSQNTLTAGPCFSVGGCGMFAGVFPQWKDGAIVGSRSRAIVWRGVRGRNSPFLHLMHRRQDGLGFRKRAHCYSRQPAASEAGPAG